MIMMMGPGPDCLYLVPHISDTPYDWIDGRVWVMWGLVGSGRARAGCGRRGWVWGIEEAGGPGRGWGVNKGGGGGWLGFVSEGTGFLSFLRCGIYHAIWKRRGCSSRNDVCKYCHIIKIIIRLWFFTFQCRRITCLDLNTTTPRHNSN